MGILRKEIVPRSYQLAIAQSALQKGNTLVVLPTGMGKTLIAFLVVAERIGLGRVVFLAPTKPLVQQHHKSFLEAADFPPEDAALITGEIAPKKRQGLWQKRICFSTPQSFKNDILAGRADASCSLCVIDEAHRAVGNYAYTFIASEVAKKGGMILGLTASPGGDRRRIQEIVDALGIQNIEIRTAYDADVAPYVKRLDIEHVKVPLGGRFSEVRRLLSAMLSEHAEHLSSMGFPPPLKSKKGLVELRARIMKASEKIRYGALSLYSTIFNLAHMLELIETQGLSTFLSYVQKLRAREETKARRRIFSDRRFAEALRLCKEAEEHPKMGKLLEIVSARGGEKILVFTQYRDQVKAIVEALRSKGVLAERFVGKKEGVTAEEQKRTIERFSKGEFDVMVATSIGEEGLDIPSVDTVVFFEPIPSEIRTIQRRGRAGRLKAGRVVVLMAEGTRDEAHFHSSRKKEERMRRIVGRMQAQFSRSMESPKANPPKRREEQKKLTDF
ncbi:MAG: helicase-related protein [Candidatus Micrarchaeota archaeon]|nr:helicase-related protein [Candidatus Micrarchaeota archaeon]